MKSREDLKLERRLLPLAEEWAGAKDTDLLLRGRLLTSAEEWLANNESAPSILRGFVETSASTAQELLAREQAQQLQRIETARASAQAQQIIAEQAQELAVRSQRFALVVGVAGLVAMSLAIAAYRQQREATALAFAAQAGDLLGQGDRPQAINLALRSRNIARTPEGNSAMLRVMTTAVLSGHLEAIVQVVFSPDGKLIATVGGGLEGVRVWTSDGQPVAVLSGHQGFVTRARFSPDSKRIVTTAAWDRVALVRSIPEGTIVAKLDGHDPSGVMDAQFSPEGNKIVTSSSDGARVFDASTGRQIAMLEGPSSAPVFSPDGRRILSRGAYAALWDPETGHIIIRFDEHTAAVRDAEFSPDGSKIVTTGADRTVRIWNASNGAIIAVLSQSKDTFLRASLSFDGRKVLTLSAPEVLLNGVPTISAVPGTRMTAMVWDVVTGKPLAQLVGHTGLITTVQFSPNGQEILTAGVDDTLRLWNSATGEMLATIPADVGGVNEATYSPDGYQIVAAGNNKAARVWNRTYAQLIARLSHGVPIYDAAFTSRAVELVTAGNDGARVWNIATGKPGCLIRARDNGLEDQYVTATFLPDGLRIMTASTDAFARLWNASNCLEIARYDGATGDYLETIKVSHNGSRLLTVPGDAPIALWNVTNGRRLAVLDDLATWIMRSA